MPRNPKVDFDLLQMYFGEPYVIDLEGIPGKVTVLSPTIGDIVRIGEEKFYQTLNLFVCNTTQYRVVLWDLGIDWNEFSDFSLFVMLYKQADPDVVKLLFGDLDLQKFEPMLKQLPPKLDSDSREGDGEQVNEEPQAEIILWNDEDEIEINADVHNHFSQYLRVMFNTFPDEKITQMDTLKNWYITKDRRAIEQAKKKPPKKVSIQPIVSACVNHPGFKYKLSELKEVGVFEFYDSVSRLQIYEQSTALMKGMYSGMIDGSKIKSEDYNFMREIVRDANNSVSKKDKLKDQG